MERNFQICKLALFLIFICSFAFGAEGDTVIDGMPVGTLSPDRIVRTDGNKVLTSSGCTALELSTLTNGSNADDLHIHTNAGVTVTHASTTGQTANDHHNEVHTVALV